MPRPWTVLPHGPLQQREENLWDVEGDLPDMPLKRRMVLARFADGGLLIHSALCLDEPTLREVEALGEPAVLVVPNGWHRLDAHAWAARYPRMRVFCPQRAVRRVRQVVEVHGTYESFPADPSVTMEPLEGAPHEGVLRVRSGDRVSLAFADAVMNNPHGTGLWWRLYRLLDATGGPRVTRMFKLVATSDRTALKDHLLRLAATPGLSRLIPCHGLVVEGEAAPAALRRAAECL